MGLLFKTDKANVNLNNYCLYKTKEDYIIVDYIELNQYLEQGYFRTPMEIESVISSEDKELQDKIIQKEKEIKDLEEEIKLEVEREKTLEEEVASIEKQIEEKKKSKVSKG